MTYTLFELAQNQVVQDKARDNVKKVLAKHDGLFTYESVLEMTYVENCVLGRICYHQLIAEYHQLITFY